MCVGPNILRVGLKSKLSKHILTKVGKKVDFRGRTKENTLEDFYMPTEIILTIPKLGPSFPKVF